MRHPSEDEPSSAPPRFPVARVAACGVGLLAAAYVWLGWGYCREVTPADLVAGKPPVGFAGWEGRYVRVRGRPYASGIHGIPAWTRSVRAGTDPGGKGLRHWTVLVDADAGAAGHKALVRSKGPLWTDLREEDLSLDDRPVLAVRGRVARQGRQLAVDATLGRVDGMSLIAVVAAFWSAVFMYLWLADWRRARRRFQALREEGGCARGA